MSTANGGVAPEREAAPVVVDQVSQSGADRRDVVLKIEDLWVEFEDRGTSTLGLAGVSLTLSRGRITALVGESGSGKTVTGMSTMGLLDHRVSKVQRGSIEVRRPDGNYLQLSSLNEADWQKIRGAEIAMIFQDPLTSLNPVMRVGSQVVEAITAHHKMSRRDSFRRGVELLTEVGMGDGDRVMRSYPHELSGGMRQRVSIAMALAGDPTVLVADEPTTALDVTIQAQICTLLKGLAKKRDLSVLFVTHDLSLAADLADRVCVMYAGEVVEEGEAKDVLEHPRHPYTAALIQCIPDRRIGQDIQPISGSAPRVNDVLGGCRFASRCAFATAACRAAPVAMRAMEPDHRVRCVRAEELRLGDD